jgi:hypothetical protein
MVMCQEMSKKYFLKMPTKNIICSNFGNCFELLGHAYSINGEMHREKSKAFFGGLLYTL